MSKNRRNPLSAAASGLLGRFAPKPKVFGYVEHIDSEGARGWAIHRDGDPLELSLRVGGSLFRLETTWVERRDVAQKHGHQFGRAGFHTTYAAQDQQAIETLLISGSEVQVLANGVPLKGPGAQARRLSALTDEPLDIDIKSPTLTGKVEAWGHFLLHGWVSSTKAQTNTFRLICNGVEHECSVLAVARPDVSRFQGGDKGEIGFELELPGYLWESVPAGEAVRLELSINGEAIALSSMLLDRKKALSWIGDILQLKEGKERQYRMLMALEHAHFGGLFDGIEDVAAADLARFAARMGLDDYLPEATQAHGASMAGGPPATTILMWQALRALNGRMDDGPVFPHVKAVLEQHSLIGAARDQYLCSVVPLLCRFGEFEALREIMNFSELHSFEESEDVWHRSLALPALVADGLLDRATALVWGIARRHEGGWLNTECVHYAVQAVARAEWKGRLTQETAEKFRYAVIGLLDGFKGEWFSRLHDRELIDTLLSLLEGIPNFTNNLRDDVVRAAIRVYGLNPAFWARLDERCIPPAGELAWARQVWNGLVAELTDAATPMAGRLGAIRRRLDYFARHQNPEVAVYLRDVQAHVLPHLNERLDSDGRELIERLLALGPTEAFRIAAAPLNAANRLAPAFPDTSGQLLHTLRKAGERHVSSVYDLQVEAAHLLAEIDDVARQGSAAALGSLLDRLEAKAMALSNGAGRFLGAELFARAYLVAGHAGRPGERYLMRLGEVVRFAVEHTEGTGYLAAPVHAAIGSLLGGTKETLLDSFLREMRELIKGRFGDRHGAMFRPPVPERQPLHSAGTYGDTLVVVYSCRKYLDSRVEAIRRTWIEDLKRRDIPYVILVGGGDDSLQGDVLALDVSDLYEDLPKKSLKLFDWVYRNTNAQYVLKIDDDCYLDVGRYFDTLSYRKHHYYGRVIFCPEGGMVRVWHQAKSHSEHGRKSIDKSPEPSKYADGGGAYSLSRHGLAMLHEAQKTTAGRRLIANSFMEDKLIGDLLGLKGLHPSNEDYESCQRRRTFGEAMPVAMVENTFLPNRFTPTKVVHLDTDQDMSPTRDRALGGEIWPKKLWSTAWPPSIKFNSNQLELLGDPSRAMDLLQADCVVVVVVRNEMTMLDHFLAHYRRLGLGCFVFVDNCSDDGTREHLARQPDVVLYSADTEYKASHFGVAWQQAVLGNLCLNKWVLLADADELLVFEECERRPLSSFIQDVEAEGADGVRVDMIDMYPFGDLAEANFGERPPFEAAPWFDRAPLIPWRLGSGYFSNGIGATSSLRHRLDPNAVPNAFSSQKIALFRYRPWVRVSEGVHDASNLIVSSRRAWFGHFKYHSGFKDKVMQEIKRKQHFNSAFEYRRYAMMLAEGRGAFGNAALSACYAGSESFNALPT